MKSVPVHDAVGMVLCHDVTRIVPGEFKGPAFKKGHIIAPRDIELLLDMGKASVYVYDLAEGYLHEDDAAARIASAAAGPGLQLTPPSEGRVNLTASREGLLKVNSAALARINSVEDIVFATLHSNLPVGRNRAVGGTRIIPLVIAEEAVRRVEAVCREHAPVIEIKALRALRVGIVTTGSEVFHGRIEDKFGPVLHGKFAELNCPVLGQVFASDDPAMTAQAIRKFVEDGAELVAVTGGMSVDPDDRTPAAIRDTGARIVTYGAPVFPGAMFLLAYMGAVPIIGLPGCVMYHRTSIFDLIVPRLLAGECLAREDFLELGYGGYCSGCAKCTYPHCGFGKHV
ncbi:MAG: molybdopterin-binding protein [Desulfobacterales bacterium]|nr:molybdopterin-binding protein [Desulfobacterales bacterium]